MLSAPLGQGRQCTPVKAGEKDFTGSGPLEFAVLQTPVVCIPLSESESEVAQSCPTHCHPTDCSLSGSSIHGIFQARVLGWIAVSFSRGPSPIAGRCFTMGAIREAHLCQKFLPYPLVLEFTDCALKCVYLLHFSTLS